MGKNIIVTDRQIISSPRLKPANKRNTVIENVNKRLENKIKF